MAGRRGPLGLGLAGPALWVALVIGPAPGAPRTSCAICRWPRPAWLSGKLGEAQVAALARARTPATEAAMERDEEMLVGEAVRLRFDSFVRVLGDWSQHADPDGAEDDAASGRAARRFHLSQSFRAKTWFPAIRAI